ncbi:MAG: hypothetical protein K2M42_04185 [Oscillospiraceae bacterium]|nr:hypothetical protein [Oscillospiraceae bacterium]
MFKYIKAMIKLPLVIEGRWKGAKRIVDTDYCLPYIEMRITTRCNMKCKHCGHLIPRYGQNASDMTFQDFKKHFDHLINAVSFIKVLSLVGGETPLSRYLLDIVNYVLESQKVGEIRIVSNGKELPSEDLLKLIGNTRVVMHFSQYEMHSENYPVIRELCQRYHVQTFFYHDEPSKQFWYDYGEIKDYHHTKIMMACTSYDCYLGGARQYTNGKLFQCPRLSNAYDLGLIDFPESDLLEITDDVEESRKNLRKFYSRRYSYGCRYCNAPEKKKVKMAEQLE